MKYLFLSLALSLTGTSFAKILTNIPSNILVTCQLQDFSTCDSCQERVRVACADQEYIGSLNLSLKPAQLEWHVTNSENGTEKRLTVENKTLSLKDIKNAKDLKTLAIKQKVKIVSGETVSLAAIQIPIRSKLYKSNKGPDLLAQQMKPPLPNRSIASIGSTKPADLEKAFAGGVKRAQSLKEKK